MTEVQQNTGAKGLELSKERIRRRYAKERRFRLYGLSAILLALTVLVLLIATLTSKSWTDFSQTYIALPITFDSALIDRETPSKSNFRGIVRKSVRELFPNVKSRRAKRDLYKMFSNGIKYELRDLVLSDTSLIGSTKIIWVKSSSDIDMLMKGHIDRNVPQSNRRVKDKQLGWFDQLQTQNRIELKFNSTLFSKADSREPEQAGILGAMIGSILSLIVTVLLAFPIGIMSALYLEEFAPKNRWTDLIEVNINNLAAVPSIVFGLLGLAVFLNFFEMTRSAPLVGGIVLALMTLPTIIISGRASLMAVPPSIREAALGIGASKMQTVLHHVTPLAMPGMLTGAIIGMARALGETAPLLMIGMVAFIVDIPKTFNDAATVMPVQIYLWADAPERAFVEKTAAATVILLVFLILMNLGAILLRKKFERRW